MSTSLGRADSTVRASSRYALPSPGGLLGSPMKVGGAHCKVLCGDSERQIVDLAAAPFLLSRIFAVDGHTRRARSGARRASFGPSSGTRSGYPSARRPVIMDRRVRSGALSTSRLGCDS